MIWSTLSPLTKQTIRSGAAADFDKATLDHVGGTQFAPQVPGKGEERQQLRQIAAAAEPSPGKLGTNASGKRERRLRPAPGFRLDRSPGLRLSLRRSRASAFSPECSASCVTPGPALMWHVVLPPFSPACAHIAPSRRIGLVAAPTAVSKNRCQASLVFAIQFAPETLLHLFQKMLEVLSDRDYLRHRV